MRLPIDISHNHYLAPPLFLSPVIVVHLSNHYHFNKGGFINENLAYYVDP